MLKRPLQLVRSKDQSSRKVPNNRRTAIFKIVDAPHMTPYMVSIGL
jgi:hypothetical protein